MQTHGTRQAASTPALLRSASSAGHWRRQNEYRAGAYMTAAVEAGERWVTKQQLAEHLQVTRRWIESQQPLGLPFLRMGGMNRYILSEVEAWLHEQYASTPPEGS